MCMVDSTARPTLANFGGPTAAGYTDDIDFVETSAAFGNYQVTAADVGTIPPITSKFYRQVPYSNTNGIVVERVNSSTIENGAYTR